MGKALDGPSSWFKDLSDLSQSTIGELVELTLKEGAVMIQGSVDCIPVDCIILVKDGVKIKGRVRGFYEGQYFYQRPVAKPSAVLISSSRNILVDSRRTAAVEDDEYSHMANYSLTHDQIIGLMKGKRRLYLYSIPQEYVEGDPLI